MAGSNAQRAEQPANQDAARQAQANQREQQIQGIVETQLAGQLEAIKAQMRAEIEQRLQQQQNDGGAANDQGGQIQGPAAGGGVEGKKRGAFTAGHSVRSVGSIGK